MQTLLDTTAVMFAKYCIANGALLISHCLLTLSNIGLLSVDFPRSLKHSTLLGLIDILLKLSGFISGLADAVTSQWIGEVPLLFAFNALTQPLDSPIPELASNRNVITFSCTKASILLCKRGLSSTSPPVLTADCLS